MLKFIFPLNQCYFFLLFLMIIFHITVNYPLIFIIIFLINLFILASLELSIIIFKSYQKSKKLIIRKLSLITHLRHRLNSNLFKISSSQFQTHFSSAKIYCFFFSLSKKIIFFFAFIFDFSIFKFLYF